MGFERPLKRPHDLDARRLASAGGILFSVLLLPRVAPMYMFQPFFGIGSLLHFGVFVIFQALQMLFQVLQIFVQSIQVLVQSVYGATSREWLTGAAFAGGYIRKALFEIEAERKFTEAERDAFQEFAERVKTMSVWTDVGANSNAAVLTKVNGGGNQLREIRQWYRESVMAVPNYDEVYDESFRENFAAEFGDDLATVVTGGAQFTRPVQELLIKQALTSATRREEHLDVLDTELTSVTQADARLRRVEPLIERTAPQKLIHCSFEELIDYERDIRCATEDCRQVLEDRQREIHESNQQLRSRSNRTSLQEYLYRSIDPSFPVLAASLERVHELNDRRRAVIKSIARRY